MHWQLELVCSHLAVCIIPEQQRLICWYSSQVDEVSAVPAQAELVRKVVFFYEHESAHHVRGFRGRCSFVNPHVFNTAPSHFKRTQSAPPLRRQHAVSRTVEDHQHLLLRTRMARSDETLLTVYIGVRPAGSCSCAPACNIDCSLAGKITALQHACTPHCIAPTAGGKESLLTAH